MRDHLSLAAPRGNTYQQIAMTSCHHSRNLSNAIGQTHIAHRRDRRAQGSPSPVARVAAQSLVLMQAPATGFRCGSAHIGDRLSRWYHLSARKPTLPTKAKHESRCQKSCWDAMSKALSGSRPLGNNSLGRNGLPTRVATRTSLFRQSFDRGNVVAPAINSSTWTGSDSISEGRFSFQIRRGARSAWIPRRR